MDQLIKHAENFARQRHKGQIRKGILAEPYISHVADVARLTQEFGGGSPEICAAWLHDTVEDCPPTSFDELAREFSPEIAGIVAELSDDKSLAKAERKRLQIVNAPKKTRSAAIVKLADKSSNVRSIATSPASDWDYDRRMGYLRWASEVVAALPFRPLSGLLHFIESRDLAEIAIVEELADKYQARQITAIVSARRDLRDTSSPEKLESELVEFIN